MRPWYALQPEFRIAIALQMNLVEQSRMYKPQHRRRLSLRKPPSSLQQLCCPIERNMWLSLQAFDVGAQDLCFVFVRCMTQYGKRTQRPIAQRVRHWIDRQAETADSRIGCRAGSGAPIRGDALLIGWNGSVSAPSNHQDRLGVVRFCAWSTTAYERGARSDHMAHV